MLTFNDDNANLYGHGNLFTGLEFRGGKVPAERYVVVVLEAPFWEKVVIS